MSIFSKSYLFWAVKELKKSQKSFSSSCGGTNTVRSTWVPTRRSRSLRSWSRRSPSLAPKRDLTRAVTGGRRRRERARYGLTKAKGTVRRRRKSWFFDGGRGGGRGKYNLHGYNTHTLCHLPPLLCRSRRSYYGSILLVRTYEDSLITCT